MVIVSYGKICKLNCLGEAIGLPFNNFNISSSCKTPNPTNYPQNFHPLEPCLHCSSLYHNSGDCPHLGQFSNFSCRQLNTSFFGQGFE
jgi:hypothetical protein